MNQEEQPTQPSVPPIEPEQPVTQHQGHTISVNLPQARMPVPGNAEWLLWLIVEIVFAIIWITSDAFDAGATEVHVRVSSPPIVGPCFYGIDFAAEDELIAARHTVEEVRKQIGATSLAYISLEGLTEATRRPEHTLCRACLTGRYPTRIPDGKALAKLRFEPARS